MAPSARKATARLVRSGLARAGFDLVRRARTPSPIPIDCDDWTASVIRAVQPYTLTPPERVMALCEAVRYVEAAEIPGAIVECGVWRGGSMMATAMTLCELGKTDRDLFMYDTFEYMPPPGERDAHVTGFSWKDRFVWNDETKNDPVFKYLPFDEVKKLILSTGYPPDRLHFVQGLVEETIPEQAPPDIALCRLDTDWYESTAHEMKHLYPRIAPSGVLLIDDYGEFMGAKAAVDEHLKTDGRPVLMHRVDASCRLIVVPARREHTGPDQDA